MSGPQPRITTLVYAIRDGRIVLMHRRKEPNLGLWSPPGGKIEPGESPLDSALRELTEETGLIGTCPRLAAVVSELDTVLDDACLMFIFRVDVPRGDPAPSHREGECRWIPLSEIAGLAIPPADPYILDAVLADDAGVTFLAVRFEDGRLVDVDTRRDHREHVTGR